MSMKRLNGEHSNIYEASIETGVGKSETCKKIMEYLKKESCPFDVILLNENEKYGQMLTELDQSSPDAQTGRKKFKNMFGEDKIQYPVVLWNPYYKFDYFGDVEGVIINPSGDVSVPQERALKPGDMYLQHVTNFGTTKVPVVLMTEATMPSWLVLFHELGHVVQYYESGGEAGWGQRLTNVDAIEAENLKLHENPICRHVQLPIRAHYKHMSFGFAGLIQTYSSNMKKQALIKEPNAQALAAKKRQLVEEAKKNAKTPKAPGFFIK